MNRRRSWLADAVRVSSSQSLYLALLVTKYSLLLAAAAAAANIHHYQ